jgi:CubicO group peptidase (beta-lactamase class C family)
LGTVDAVMVSGRWRDQVAHYRNGSKPEDALHVWSVTKSVVSALIGIAIAEMIIPQSRRNAGRSAAALSQVHDAEEKAITLRQLMTMTAGFPGDEPLENIHGVYRAAHRPGADHSV